MHSTRPSNLVLPAFRQRILLIALCFLAAISFTSSVLAAGIGEIFQSWLPSLDLMVSDGQLVWRQPLTEYIAGVFFGLALALLSVYRLAASKAKAKPLLLDTPLSRYSYRRALLTNSFVWVYVLLIVGFAGLIYSGVFTFLREKIEDTMPTWVSWGTTGASVLATFTWTLLSRHFSWFKAGSGVQLDKVVDDLEKQSASGKEHWIQTIAWSPLDTDCDTKISELAYRYSVGFICRAVTKHCHTAIDRGRIDDEKVETILSDLAAIPSGDDDRDRFANRRLAIQIASQVVALEELENLILSTDRRAAERRQTQQEPQTQERRHDIHRRVDGLLVTEAA